MARFRPFRGIRYSQEKVGAMDDIVAPPYDVIDDTERDRLHDGNPFNVTRLILNPEGHDKAAAQYRDWQSEGVLTRDDAPAFYLYTQEFECDGEPKRRVGLIGALHLEAFSTGVVRRHETTFAAHKKDRLNLTGKAKANLSPIFAVYSNPEFHPEPDAGWNSPADVDVTVDGVRHRVWPVTDAGRIAAVEKALEGRTVYIADGHHRYETALDYYQQLHGQDPRSGSDAPGDDEAPTAHVMAFLAAFEDPGMVILPTHRELKSSGGADHAAFAAALAKDFSVEEIPVGAEGRQKLRGLLEEHCASANCFGVALSGLDHYLFLRRPVDKASEGDSPLSVLDVTALHDLVLGTALQAAGGTEASLGYGVDADDQLNRVAAGDLEGVFLMNATRPEEMAAVCESGELMPQKSTYFYPKLLTGLTFHSLEK